MDITPGIAAEVLALLGKRLLQIDPDLLGRFNQFGANILQPTAVGVVRNRFEPPRVVHHHPAELLGFHQLEFDSYVDGLLQLFLLALFAQQPAKFDRRGGVARMVVLKVRLPREELPSRRLAPALDNSFLGLVQCVLEVQQRDHVINARVKEILDCKAGKQPDRTPRKHLLLKIKLGVLRQRDRPCRPVFMWVPGILQRQKIKLHLKNFLRMKYAHQSSCMPINIMHVYMRGVRGIDHKF